MKKDFNWLKNKIKSNKIKKVNEKQDSQIKLRFNEFAKILKQIKENTKSDSLIIRNKAYYIPYPDMITFVKVWKQGGEFFIKNKGSVDKFDLGDVDDDTQHPGIKIITNIFKVIDSFGDDFEFAVKLDNLIKNTMIVKDCNSHSLKLYKKYGNQPPRLIYTIKTEQNYPAHVDIIKSKGHEIETFALNDNVQSCLNKYF